MSQKPVVGLMSLFSSCLESRKVRRWEIRVQVVGLSSRSCGSSEWRQGAHQPGLTPTVTLRGTPPSPGGHGEVEGGQGQCCL